MAGKLELEQTDPQEDSELDAEGEEDDDFEALDNGHEEAPVVQPGNADSSDEDGSNEDSEAEEAVPVEEESAASSDDSNSSSDSEAENEEEWANESDTAEEADIKTAESGRCIYCGEDEENDPSEEFEEYLECSVCGDNAHRQCARDNNSLSGNEGVKKWRCSSCLVNGVEPETSPVTGSRRRSSAKVTRELLPGGRGVNNPDSHSVFNTLILDDDPLDGSRSLRKRKVSETEPPMRDLRKRQRHSARSASAGAMPSPSVFSASGDDTTVNGEIVVAGDPPPNSNGEPPSRPRLRQRKSEKPLVAVEHSASYLRLVVTFNLDKDRLAKILSSKPRKNRGTYQKKKKIQVSPMVEPDPPHYPAIQSGYSAQFYTFIDREDDQKSKPYGGILSEGDADTSKTFPLATDRKRFEEARLKAEDDWKKKMAETNNLPEPTKLSQKHAGPPSKIKCINFGGYEIDTWNAAPYPEEYSRNKILYICEFCLKYMNSDFVAWRHKLKCPAKHPPGDEIYRDGRYSFFEVDGRKNPVYCQNLCLLAKLFLGSKTLYYDVEPFLFYVMTENNDLGCHFVGYFSKEKRPSSLNNVSCILVLPIFQRRGFGHMLIEFSYLLTKVERKTGSPEKPLSDMGLVSYRNYWRLIMCQELIEQKGPTSIGQISERTGMTPDDVISALEGLRALARDPVTKTYALRIDHKYMKEYIAKHEKKNYPRILPEALVWTPYVMNRGLSLHYEGGGPLHTVAQREDEEEEEEEDELPVAGLGIKDVKEEPGFAQIVNGGSPGYVPVTNGVNSGSKSPRTAEPSHPSTPLANGHTSTPNSLGTPYPGFAVPPARYEVFPHVKGFTPKRGPGRPPGSRTRGRPPTIPRTASGTVVSRPSIARAHVSTGSPSVRRSMRSALGEMDEVNGLIADTLGESPIKKKKYDDIKSDPMDVDEIQHDDDEEDDEQDAEGEEDAEDEEDAEGEEDEDEDEDE